MRLRCLAALVAAFALGGAAQAQRANPPEPTFELRLRSVSDLVDKGDYLVKLVGQDELGKKLRAFVAELTADGKGIEGVDHKRPFGLYASLSLDVTNSPVTLMVPIADRDRFLKLLENKANLKLEKGEGGTLTTTVELGPDKSFPLVLRFANDYLYVGRTVQDLDPKLLITPKAYFGKDDGSVASFLFRVDRVPPLMRKALVTKIHEWGVELRNQIPMQNNALQQVSLDWFQASAVEGLTTLVEDSKELSVRIFIDDKTDFLSAELSLVPRPDTTLAKNIASLGSKKSLAAGIVAVKEPIARASISIAMTEEVTKRFGPVVDTMVAQLLADAKGDERPLAKSFLESISPTLKAAEIDMAVTLAGPDAKGRHTLLAAVAVKQGKGLEKFAKEVVAKTKEFAALADITFDVEKVGEFSLHKVVLKDVPEEVEKFFGSKTLWVAVSNEIIAMSLEPDATALKAGLKARAIPVPVAVLEVSIAKLIPMVAKDLKPEELKAMIAKVFGNAGPAGRDTITLSITGGDQLTVKAKIEGKAIRLITAAIKGN